MKTLALIPARGGSKAIPRKNLAMLCGRPLLYYTCVEAKAASRLDRVMLSTDDEEIRQIGLSLSVEAPFLRPPEFSGDAATSLSVVEHSLDWLEREEGYRPDIVVLLQPTSPLRRAEHIDATVASLVNTPEADGAVTVIKVPHNCNPYSVMQVRDHRLVPLLEEKPEYNLLRRQDHPVLLARNGPAVLAVRTTAIRQQKRLYCMNMQPVLMENEDSVDIDTAEDLKIAEALMLYRNGGRS
jgi:CMP-N-acetylneuraminic acid synthetase